MHRETASTTAIGEHHVAKFPHGEPAKGVISSGCASVPTVGADAPILQMQGSGSGRERRARIPLGPGVLVPARNKPI